MTKPRIQRFAFLSLTPEGRQQLASGQSPYHFSDEVAVAHSGDELEDSRTASGIWGVLHPGHLLLSMTPLSENSTEAINQ